MNEGTILEFINNQFNSRYKVDLGYSSYICINSKRPTDIFKFPLYNLFPYYIEMFKDIQIKYKFDVAFHMQPKKLSFQLYKTIDLWLVLLLLNKCKTDIDFVGDIVYIPDPNKVDDIMGRIYKNEDIVV